MKLEKLTVRGYKSIRSLEDFNLNNLNVLIGANGAGKSNLISLFRLLATLAENNLQSFTREQGGADVFLFNGDKHRQTVIVDLFFLNEAGAGIIYDLELKRTQDNRMLANFERWSLSEGTDDAEGMALPLMMGHGESILLNDPSPNGQAVRKAMQSWRQYHFHDTSPEAKVKQPHSSNDNLLLKSDAANLAAYLYRLKAESPDAYRRIVDTVRLAAPFFGDFVIREPMPLRVELEWTERGDPDTPYRAHALSDGTLRFICLTTLLLQPVDYLPDTVLIDEPELGLHPYAINLLADMIKEVAETKQLIVSTQSVELLNAFAPEDIVVVEREGRASTFKRLDAEDLQEWLQDYTLGELWQRNIIGGRPSR